MRRDAPLILLAITLLYLFVGTLGHDPWRGDDVTHFGPVFEILDGGPALIPSIAGEVFPDFGPLYYWIAAAFAAALNGLLPLHDGARLATSVLAASALWALWRAAHHMHGSQARTGVVLLTLGTLGLAVHAHEMQPAIGLLAAQAWLLWLLTSPARLARPAAGLAAGAAFLFAGLQGVLTTWPLLFAPLAPGEPRERGGSGGRLAALPIALLVVLAWAIPAVAQHGWQTWLAAQLDSLRPGALEIGDVANWFKLFGWFLWPLWPLALWSLWRARLGASIRYVPVLLAATALALAGVLLSGGLRSVRMLPLVVPLALLAAPAVERLRRGAAAAFDWFAVMTFSLAGLMLWLAWSAVVMHWPPGLARHFRKLAPAFESSVGTPALVLGGLVVAAWFGYLWWRRSGGRDAATTWAAGMTTLWCIAASMLQPWFDHTRSYRQAGDELAAAVAVVPALGQCVAGVGLGAAQRSAIHYFAGIRVVDPGRRCPLVLVYADTRMGPRNLSDYGSTRLWSYQRGGGRQLERFVLLRRD